MRNIRPFEISIIGLLSLLSACSVGEEKPQIDAKTEAAQWNTLDGNAPLVIAHRGASGYLPEHTLEAYDLAIEMGADFIEPDLVITKDGELVVRHDRYLSDSTDVADHPEFADRKTVKPGHDGADWFVEDFTLAEIKTLRAKQVKAGRPTEFDGLYEIPTFDEVLELVTRRSEETGRRIGIYPETKQPDALEALDLSFDTALLDSLAQFGFDGADDPVFIQSFETENLRRLSEKTDIRLIYLLWQPLSLSIEEIAGFADGIGPYKLMLIDDQGASTGLLEDAHAMGLPVHTWTFRDDDVTPQFRGNSKDELTHFMNLGVDGLFSDFPDTALTARETFK
ncbi:MAG: glycerophosphodiester phosphodiesterase family protein [Pseudomonadota bacterium]